MGDETKTGDDGKTTTAGTTGETVATTVVTPPVTLTAERRDDNVVIIDGKQYVVQDHVNSLVGTARTEGKTAGKTEAEQAADLIRQNAEAASLTEQGQFKTLYETEQAKVTRLESELQTARKETADLKLTDLRRTVAAKHGIPDKLVGKISGTTEAEMDADAAIIAESLGTPKAVSTQTGKGGPGTGGTDAAAVEPDTDDRTPDRKVDDPKRQRFAFESSSDISW